MIKLKDLIKEFVPGTMLDARKKPGDYWKGAITDTWYARSPKYGWRNSFDTEEEAKMWAEEGKDLEGYDEETAEHPPEPIEEDDAKETGYKKVDEIDSSLNEFQGKRLAVFDFDDTLAKSEAYIYVTKSNGEELKLDPAKYAVYEEEPGDKFDFRDFNSKLQNPQTIDANVKRLKAELGNPQTKVTVLTARGLAFPLRYFFKNEVGISPYVVGVGSSDPMKKAKWIEAHIKKGYNSIFFIDDSPKNIAAVDTLKQKYPNLDIETELAE